MKELLELLNIITPTWAIGVTASLTVLSYLVKFWRIYKLWKYDGRRINAIMIDVPMTIAFIVLWITYSATWFFDIPIETRAPVSRLLFLMLSAFDLARNILRSAK